MALYTLLLLISLGYAMIYFSQRKYLENFHDAGIPYTQIKGSKCGGQLNSPIPEKPYATNPIEDMDDYEISAVHHHRGSREVSKKQISDAMTRYPVDWTVQGPDSQYFQENQVSTPSTYVPQPPSINPALDHSMKLPDATEQEEEEKKILQTYQPKKSKDLLHYAVEDVKEMIDKIYDKKGLIPVIEKSKQGNNVWEISEVKEKNPIIVWEDSPEAQQKQLMETRGENVIEVPQEASDLSAGLDPFFQARGSTRKGKSDYTKWTPGLERMFAPTYPVKSWF